MFDIVEATTDSEILHCFPVMRQLRPHLLEAEFLPRVRRQIAGGYRLVFSVCDQKVVAVGGFRLLEMLNRGLSMYVDDLVTDEYARGKGHGSRLLDWLVQKAIALGCERFHLDSGVQRFEAHRFYLHKGMDITAHHFSMKLPKPP